MVTVDHPGPIPAVTTPRVRSSSARLVPTGRSRPVRGTCRQGQERARLGTSRWTGIVCDFSDYSRLHTVVYQEIIAGRGHRIEDAAVAVRLAERVCGMVALELPAAR
jgi:hypothetical protein